MGSKLGCMPEAICVLSIASPAGRQVRILVGDITPPDGAPYERSTKCTRKSEARAVAERWDRETALARNPITLEQAFDRLYQHKRDKHCSAATFEILDLKVAHLLGFFGRDRLVDSLRRDDVLKYLRHRRAKGVSDQTIELELKELRAALRQLAAHELYDRNPSALWPKAELRPAKKRTRWLTPDEFKRLWAALGGTTGYWRKQRHGAGRHGGAEQRRQWIEHKDPMGQDWRDHLTMYCYTGMRLSELYRVTAKHVDGDHLTIAGTKTEGAERIVPLAPEALAVVQRRSDRYPRGPLFPLALENMEAQERAWLRALAKACKHAALVHASTNDLRRTFCSWAWQGGVPLELVVRWMGHASTRMVMEVYGQTSKAQGREHIARLPRADA
jgi:integrase